MKREFGVYRREEVRRKVGFEEEKRRG